jgi:hypothetical protein
MGKLKMVRLPEAIPDREKKVMLSTEVNAELLEHAKAVALANDLFQNEAFEYGLKSFILAYDPKRAAKIGIK